MTTFPALVAMRSDKPFGWMDIVAAVLMLGFIVWETVADEQQWRFQTKKWAMIKEGNRLEDLPEPYNKGFNATGLWGRSRHPNYFAEHLGMLLPVLHCCWHRHCQLERDWRLAVDCAVSRQFVFGRGDQRREISGI